MWNEPGNRDLYRAMLTAADLTHAAYDCPKNFSAQLVLAAIKKVMAEFKIKHSVPRSTWGFAWKLARAGFRAEAPPRAGFRAEAPPRPWEAFKDFLPDGVDFGSVWLPMEKVVLGREAGRWANAIWLKMKKYEWLAWRQDARTCSLVELLCFLHNKLVKPAPEAHRLNFSAEAIAFFRAAVPLCRCTQLSTADQLYRSTCF